MARILVIDDDDMMRGILEEMFTREGHEVTSAEHGKAGVAFYRREPYDLVITDLFMPEKDGVEVLRELKSDYPDAKIVALSGGGSAAELGVLESLADLGVSATFAKPFRPKEVLARVEEILSDG